LTDATTGFAARRVFHGLGSDLTLAWRRLLATPMFTTFAVTSLAVGLAVTTAAYSVVATLFFAPSGISDQARIALVMTPLDGKLIGGGFSLPDFRDLRSAQQSFDHLSASAKFYPSLALPATTELVSGEAVDGQYFETLGVNAALGRTLDETDVRRAQSVVVLSHALWTLRFRSDPAIVGKEVRVAGRPFEVVGVAPKHFDGLGRKLQGTRVWIPLSADPRQQTSPLPERDRSRLIVIGHLAPAASITSASAELSSIGANLDAAYPRSASQNGRRTRAWVARPLSEDRAVDAIMFRFGLAFVALVALVLVVACTNLSNLMLARGTERHHEFAVRRALGASRWRLIRGQCAESAIVALLGTGAAWLLFRTLGVLMDVDLPLTGRMLVSFAPKFDLAVAGVAAAALLLSLFVFGLEPALQLTRGGEIRGELAGGAGSVGGPTTGRQRALVRWQIAIAAAFFIIATMCVKYAVAEARHDSGVDLDRIAVATMNFWSQQWDEPRANRAVARVLEELQQEPAIQTAAIATGVPFGSTGTAAITFSTTDKPIADRGDFPWGLGIAASPGFFRTLGISILRGRAFDDRDGAAAAPVAIISEQTALQLFGTSDAVGRQILLKDRTPVPTTRSVANKLAVPGTSRPPMQNGVRTVTIVGIAENTDVVHLFSRDGDVLYVPLTQQRGLPFAIAIVRTEASPYTGLRVLRDAIRRVDPDLAIETAGTGAGALGGPTVFLRAAATFAASLGALTLLLAMVGLYGVQAHGVTRRTREIGVRMSFGATAVHIRRMILKDGYRPVLEGLALGLFIGVVGRALLHAFLWERIDLIDPWMLVAVPIPLLIAAFLACYWPSRRASRVDPMVALRQL
jgi:predicted permease